MNIKDYVEFRDKPAWEKSDEEINLVRREVLFELKNRYLSNDEVDYLEKEFFKDGLGFMDPEIGFEIFKNLSRQYTFDNEKCRELYEYTYIFGWHYEGYIVMRLLLLGKLKTITRFCKEYKFYIEGKAQFLDAPIWEDIDFQQDFNNDFE